MSDIRPGIGDEAVTIRHLHNFQAADECSRLHSPAMTHGRVLILATACALAALILLAYYFGVR
jgi:hypothetical protein